jgi:tricorn protease
LILERLYRRLIAFDKPRRGKSYRYPYRAFRGHMVVLCNQRSGSDGDIFTEAFKLLNLGPVIGMRTWGGVVGIRSDKPFMDGGMMTEPEYAWWDPKRGWGLENEGAVPDIEIDNLPEDVVEGRDRQLEKGIEILLEMLEKAARPVPERPPYPDKSD